MSVVRQADGSFVCFGAKPDKGFWTRDLEVTGSRKGTPVRELDKGARGRLLAKGDASDHRLSPDSRETSRHERGFKPVNEVRSR